MSVAGVSNHQQSRSGFKSTGYVGESSPEASTIKVSKVEVAVEAGGIVRDGVYHDGSCSEFASPADAAGESVYEEVSTEGLSVLGTVERETGKEDDGNRVWHTELQPGWDSLVLDGAHRQRVVAHDSHSPTKDVCRGDAASGRNASRLVQPSVE
jgi:hypothetical protein